MLLTNELVWNQNPIVWVDRFSSFLKTMAETVPKTSALRKLVTQLKWMPTLNSKPKWAGLWERLKDIFIFIFERWTNDDLFYELKEMGTAQAVIWLSWMGIAIYVSFVTKHFLSIVQNIVVNI